MVVPPAAYLSSPGGTSERSGITLPTLMLRESVTLYYEMKVTENIFDNYTTALPYRTVPKHVSTLVNKNPKSQNHYFF